MVISTHPVKDRKKAREYTARYNAIGVKQLRGDKLFTNLPEGQNEAKSLAQYDAGFKSKPAERLLHLCFAETDADVETLHSKDLKVPHPKGEHTGRIFICDGKGIIVDQIHAQLGPDQIIPRIQKALGGLSK